VMGSYSEEGDRNVLTVAEFLDYQPGKSCHLSDALDALAPADATSTQGTAAGARAGGGGHATPSALVGHYYLMDVIETGSELLLRPDGQFDWALSYGAVDQEAQGMWHVERDEVVLVASAPSVQKPLFSYLSIVPWDEETEDELRQHQRSEIEATIRTRCPIFPELFVSATPLTTADNAPAPSATILQQRAVTALRAGDRCRTCGGLAGTYASRSDTARRVHHAGSRCSRKRYRATLPRRGDQDFRSHVGPARAQPPRHAALCEWHERETGHRQERFRVRPAPRNDEGRQRYHSH